MRPAAHAPGCRARAWRLVVASTMTLTLGRRVDRRRADLDGAAGRDAAAGRAGDRRPIDGDGDRPRVVPEPLTDPAAVRRGRGARRARRLRGAARGRGLRPAVRRRRRHRAAARPVGARCATDTIFDLASVSKLFTSIALDAAGRGGPDRPGPHRRVVHPGVRRQRQGGRDRAPAAHPHLGLPGLAAAVEQPADARGADPGGVRRQAGQPAGQHLPLLRPEHDHGRRAGRAGHRQAARPGRARRHHRAAAGCATPATTRRRPSSTGSPRRSTRPRHRAAWSAAACTTRTRGRSNGVAGHAGVFSTADDLAVLAQTILNGGSYGEARILQRRTGRRAAAQRERRRSRATRTGSASSSTSGGTWTGCRRPTTAGHTGYTGTSIVIDPRRRSFVILLTNRVHPSRNWGSNNPARRAVARDLALAIPVRPRRATRRGSPGWGTRAPRR